MKLLFLLLAPFAILNHILSQDCHIPNPKCGDGIIQFSAGEQCDDGNESPQDGCSDCMVECGFSCRDLWGPICGNSTSDYLYQNFSFHNSSCAAIPGDGKRVANELCDDGNLVSGDGCDCNQTGKVCGGSCIVEPRWTCSRVVNLTFACASKLMLADRCSCSGHVVNITTPCGRKFSSVDGFSGGSEVVQCKTCSKNHYGNCSGPASFCLWNETCSGQGFCAADGTCVCFGNYSGPHCSRCKQDHYGANCSTYCNSMKTCGGLGVCDAQGTCLWNAFCEGALESQDYTGNGRRLGSEQCDDGNALSGDGCDSAGQVETGFVCLGGCQPNGDVRWLFGPCQVDVCSPVPCGWTLMDTPAGESAALFVITAHLSVKMSQSNPFPDSLNMLSVTLTPNVPLPSQVSVTEILSVQISPSLQQQETKTVSVQVVLTIFNLIGALPPAGNRYIALGGSGSSFFRGSTGYWSDANNSLSLTVLREIQKNQTVEFSFNVMNSEQAQPSPDIEVATTGITMPPTLVEKAEGDKMPLKIRLVSTLGAGSAPVESASTLAEESHPKRRLLQIATSFISYGNISQSTSDLGALNVIKISFVVRSLVPSGSRITVAGLLPSQAMLLFGRTSSTQCAQALPYGPEPVGDRSAYLSTSFKDVLHSAFLQRLYDNNSLIFEIFYSFTTVRTLQERFRVARTQGESAIWFIRTPQGVDLMKMGTWKFSSNMALEGDPFAIGSGTSFSYDDGAWGGASGIVDGSIENSFNNPAISCLDTQAVCTADFWGQGNFNQDFDTGCLTKACCEDYFTGTGIENATRSEHIRNDLFLFPCTTCSCGAPGDCNQTTSVDGNSSTDQGQYACTVNQSQGWFQGFDGSAVYSPGSALQVKSRYSFSFVLRNSPSPHPPLIVSISASDARSWTNLSAPRPMIVNAPTILQSGIAQSTAFPGSLNTISVSFTVNFPIVASTVVTLSGLLPKSTMFLSWDAASCSGLQVSGTNSTVHTFFRQDLYDRGELKFQVFWAFSTSKTLQSRIQTAAQFGEPVQWRVLQNGSEYLYAGLWKLANGANIASSFIWGASNGPYSGNPTATAFWGQDSRLGCFEYFVNGNSLASTSIRHEIFMLETAYLHGMISNSYDLEAFSDGHITMIAKIGAEPSSAQFVQLLVQNQLNPRAPANVSISIVGCDAIERFLLPQNASFVPNVVGAVPGDGQPLRVRSPAFITAAMGQSVPYPAALNNITLTLAANVLLDSNAGASIQLSNLQGASAASGSLQLASPDGKSHLHFCSSPGSTAGYGYWNDTAKSLMLYVCASVDPASVIALRFVVENPPNPQTAPDVYATAQCGVNFAALVSKDMGTVGAVNISGSASALFVLCPQWLTSRTGQSSAFPADINTVTVAWSTNFAIRPSARAYSQFQIQVAGLKNAAAGSGAIPISTVCSSCFSASWNDASEVLTIQVLSNLLPLMEYVLSFNITNPSRGQQPPVIEISSSSILIAPSPACNRSSARIISTDPALLPTLAVDVAQFTMKRIGQSNPYPGAINIITITVATNVPLLIGSRTIPNGTFLNISGLQGAVFDTATPILAQSQNSSSEMRGAGFFSAALDTAAAPGIILTVIRATAKSVNYTLSFNVTNQLIGQNSPPISISCNGILIEQVVMDADNHTVPPGLPATVVGDAAPLKIYTAAFLLKDIGQSTPFPGVNNTISITLSFNANLRKSCLLYANWKLSVSNFVGGPTTSGDIVLEGPSDSLNTFTSSQYGNIGYGQWSGSSLNGGQLTVYLAEDVVAHTVYFFSFVISNPRVGQKSPQIAIQGLLDSSTSLIGKTYMNRDNKTVLPLYGGKVGDALPLQIRTAGWITKLMSQSSPLPGALNTLTTTLIANVPLFSLQDTSGSVGTPCSTSFDQYGCQSKLLSQSCLRTVVTISGLLGATIPNCSSNCSLPVSWVNSDTAPPCQWTWNGYTNAVTFTVANLLRENTTYVFSFNVLNPVAGQSSPAISIQVSGLYFTSIGIDKDLQDRAPLLVSSIQFRIKQIFQSDPYPYASNCITVLLQTNLKLTLQTVFEIYSFAGMSPVNLSYSPSGVAFIPMSDSSCLCSTSSEPTCPIDFFSAVSCPGVDCNDLLSQANWNFAKSGLTLYMAKEIAAGVNISFTFALRNAGIAPLPKTIYVQSQVGSVSFPSVAMDGVLTFISASFLVVNIGQSNPYPGAQNDITVTLAMNVPLLAIAEDVFTIAGLRGVSIPSGKLQVFGLNKTETPVCWQPCNEMLVECSSIASAIDSVPGYVYWSKDVQSISFKVLDDMNRNQSVVFRFTVTNPSKAQNSPAVSVAIITGSVPVPYTNMKTDQGIPILYPFCSGSQYASDNCQDTAAIGDASVLYIRSGQFVFTDLCMVQSSRFLGSVNTITATISTSVPISAGKSVAFYLSGLSGATMTGMESNMSTYRIIDCSGSTSNTTWASSVWNDQKKTVYFYLLADTVAFWKYVVSIDVNNPDYPQESPIITLGLQGVQFPSVQPCKDELNPPLLVEQPQLTATACQSSALPGSPNDIIVNFTTNVPLAPSLKVRVIISGFFGLSLVCNSIACLQLKGKDRDLFANSSGSAGYWNWDPYDLSLTVQVVGNTLALAQYDIIFTLENPFIAQDGQPLTIEFFLGNTQYEASLGTCQGIFKPGYVVENTVLNAALYGSTNYPGAVNQVTFLLKMQLELENTVTITYTGLTSSATADNQNLLVYCAACCSQLAVSCPCPLNNRPCYPPIPDSICAQEHFNGTANWIQGSGQLQLIPTLGLQGSVLYNFTVNLQNPVVNQQQQPSVSLKFSLSTIQGVPVTQDKSYQFPPNIDPVSFLVLSAAQSSPYPCDINVVSVNLIVNVPLGPGSLLILTGFSSAIFACDRRSGSLCMSKISSKDNVFIPFAVWKVTKPGFLNLTISNESTLDAGCTFTVELTFRNPSNGQNAPQDQSAQVLNISLSPFPQLLKIPLTPLKVGVGNNVPLKILSPIFVVNSLGMSNPNVGAVNVLTLTFATNVKLRLDCAVSLTLSGLPPSAGNLVQAAYPGPDALDPYQWRSDSCPTSERSFFTVINPSPPATCAVDFAATPQGVGSWLTAVVRDNLDSCVITDCEGMKFGTPCNNKTESEAWLKDETLVDWLHGERTYLSNESHQHVRSAFLPLGTDSCDSRWNCSALAYNDGNCAPSDAVPPDTSESGFWNSSSESLILYFRNETCPFVNYVLQFQITNPKTFHLSSFLLSAQGRGGLSIPQSPAIGPAGSSFVINAASFSIKSIGQSIPYPGASNILTMTLATNVPITERMLYYFTVIGLAGAIQTSGSIPLSDASIDGSSDHLNFRATPTGERGYGMWDNTLKHLTLLVASDLVPQVPYAISFQVFNSAAGQTSPLILIGSNNIQCAPSSRPASARISLSVKDVRGRMLDNSSYDLQSLDDFTQRPGGVWTPTSVLLPPGKWVMNLFKVGYQNESLELDILLQTNQVGISSVASEGTACDPLSVQAKYQACYWEIRPLLVETFLVPILPNVAWFVLTWDDSIVDLQVWLVAVDASGSSPWVSPNCSGQNIIQGGGVYPDCSEVVVKNSASRILVQRDISRSFGQVVLSLFNVPAGDYQVYVNVNSPNQMFSGTERGRVYLPDGTSTSIYTSLLRSQDGFWWYVGYFIQDLKDSISFRELNYDQLTTDPIPYIPGYLLDLQIQVSDSSTGLSITSSNYVLRKLVDNSVVSSGIVTSGVPGTISLEVRRLEYSLQISCSGYLSVTTYIPSTSFFTNHVYLLPLPQPRVVRLVLTGITSPVLTGVYVIPCRNAGSWFSSSAKCAVQGLIPYVYAECSQLNQGSGSISLDQPQCLTHDSFGVCSRWNSANPSFESITLKNVSSGDYDIYVSLGQGVQPADDSGLEMTISFISSGANGSLYNLSSPSIPNDDNSWWWHVGYLSVGSAGSQFVSLNTLSSDPTKDGCRIVSKSVTSKFNASQGVGITLTVGTGQNVVLNIPSGVWPSSVPSEATISLLDNFPTPIPANVTSASPVIFFDPSGISFAPPGVKMTLPITSTIQRSSLLYPKNPFGKIVSVCRLSNGIWLPLESTIIADSLDNTVGVSANTQSFSAYAILVFPGAVPEAVQSNMTISKNSTKVLVSGNTVPLGPIIGGAVGGVCFILLTAFAISLLYRQSKAGEGKKVYLIPEEHMPYKSPVEFTNSQIATEQSSRLRNSLSPFPKAKEMHEEEEPLNSDLSQFTRSEGQDESREPVNMYMKQGPLDIQQAPSVAPFAITSLIRQGLLLPPSSSVIQEPGELVSANFTMSPEKVEPYQELRK